MLFLLALLLPTKAISQPIVLEEELDCPKALPRSVAWEALATRIYLHGLASTQLELRRDRALMMQFGESVAPLLAVLLQDVVIREEETTAKTRVKAKILLSKSKEKKERIRLLAKSRDILPFIQHLLCSLENALCDVDAHWPERTLYSDQLLDNGEKNSPDSSPWTNKEWVYRGNMLKALRECLFALSLPDGDWYTEASHLDVLEKAAAILPHDPYVLTLLSEARLLRGLPEQSIESASRALSAEKKASRARYIMALAHWQLHQLGLAENDLSMLVIETQSEDSAEMLTYLRARGAVRMLLGRTDGMCEDFVRACGLGDCDGLSHVRKKNHCLNP